MSSREKSAYIHAYPRIRIGMQCVQGWITVKNTSAVILLGGVPAGDAPCLLTLPATGTSYVTAAPLRDAARHYGVTRRLRFLDGKLEDSLDNVSVYDWGHGLFEAEMWCGELSPEGERVFPYTLSQLPYEGMSAVLYYENGLWLSLESGRRLLCGFSLGAAREGELLTLGRLLVAIARGQKAAARVIAPDRSQLVFLSADSITVENGQLVTLERLRTQRGHERRTVYRAEGVQLVADEPQIGFFSHAPTAPASLPLACCEAVLLGQYAEALSMMSGELQSSLNEDSVREFFGEFAAARPFLSDSGVVGLVLPPQNGVFPIRRLCFELEGERISNITEGD